MKIIYTLFFGLWRDLFGKNGWYLPVIKSRFVQHVLAFAMTFVLCFFDKHIQWWWCLWIALWVQIEFAIGHGSCYDIGTQGEPDEVMQKRYKKMLGYKMLCKIFDEKDKHGMCFDFLLLAIRYTYPLIPICFWFNPVFMCVGLIIATLYMIYRYCPFMRKYRLLDVEIFSGFFVGFFVAFL